MRVFLIGLKPEHLHLIDTRGPRDGKSCWKWNFLLLLEMIKSDYWLTHWASALLMMVQSCLIWNTTKICVFSRSFESSTSFYATNLQETNVWGSNGSGHSINVNSLRWIEPIEYLNIITQAVKYFLGLLYKIVLNLLHKALPLWKVKYLRIFFYKNTSQNDSKLIYFYFAISIKTSSTNSSVNLCLLSSTNTKSINIIFPNFNTQTETSIHSHFY